MGCREQVTGRGLFEGHLGPRHVMSSQETESDPGCLSGTFSFYFKVCHFIIHSIDQMEGLCEAERGRHNVMNDPNICAGLLNVFMKLKTSDYIDLAIMFEKKRRGRR